MSADRAGRTRAVLFDYGLTLVTFSFPRDCLLRMLEGYRDEIVAALPPAHRDTSALDLLDRVLVRIEADLPALGGEAEIDYLAFYAAGWRDAGYELPAGLLYRLLDAEQRCWDSAVEAAPGMFHVLHSLREAGIRTGICSNAPFPPEMMRRQVQGLGLAPLLDAVVFSSEVGRRKPAPEPYLAALAALDVPAEATLFVGDRVAEDYEGPRRVGMRAVLCTALAHHSVPDGLPTIGSLQQLEDWL